MFCIRTSALKLYRSLPLAQVTTTPFIHDVDGSRRYKSWTEKEGKTLSKLQVWDSSVTKEGIHTSQINSVDLKNIGRQATEIMSTIRMGELSKAPTPVFWYGVSGLIPILGPTLSLLIIGYSPALATLQLTFAATICAFLGGVKWGYAIPENDPPHDPSWENLGWSIVPQCVATLGLLLPQTLGYLVIMAGMALAAFVDLTTANYPPWFSALRMALTIPALLALFVSFLVRLIAG